MVANLGWRGVNKSNPNTTNSDMACWYVVCLPAHVYLHVHHFHLPRSFPNLAFACLAGSSRSCLCLPFAENKESR